MKVFLVMNRFGLMSNFRLSSFWILWSPRSVFAIRWIVIEAIVSAMTRQAVTISGQWSSRV